MAIGSAILRRPNAFLMDEPLSNLDAKLRSHMRVELAALHHKLGTTTIYVTHDQTEAMTLADRIVVMKAGYIQQVATPVELYNRPHQPVCGGVHRFPLHELPERQGGPRRQRRRLPHRGGGSFSR